MGKSADGTVSTVAVGESPQIRLDDRLVHGVSAGGAALPWEERHPGNIAGHARALSTLASVHGFWLWYLRAGFYLRRRFRLFREWKAARLRKLSFIHFARWALVEQLPGQGIRWGQRPDDRLLYFESNFNGGFDDYIDAFAYVIGRQIKEIWNGAYGFPGPRPATEFKSYINRHEYEASWFYSAYPEHTVTQITAALRVDQALRGLAARTRDKPARQFAAEWHDFLRDQPYGVPRAGGRGRTRGADPNVAIDGQAYALTVFTPVKSGHEDALRDDVDGLGACVSRAFGQLARTHFARFVVIDHLTFEGPPERRPALRSPYLLFSAVLDGDRDDYLDALCRELGSTVDTIWGHCTGAPSRMADNPAAFRRWIEDHQVHTSAFFAPYGQATLGDVVASLERHRCVGRFAAETQYDTPKQLKTKFDERFRHPATGKLR